MRKQVFVVGVLTLVGAGAAQAQTAPGRWTVSPEISVEFPSGGDVHGGVDAPVADLGGLNPALAGVSATLEVESRSFDDIYGDAVSFGLEAAYGVNDSAEFFGALRYVTADEGRVQVGGAAVPALNTTLPVFGTFSDYEAWALEAGYRQYFGSSALRPYVAGRAGVVFTDAISATFEVPDAAITIANAPFYDDSTSFTAGLDVGLSYALSDRVSVQAETGIRYVSELEGDDSAIGGLGLGSINGVGDRTYVPVTLRARFVF
jgi:hypothetical protein